jgi:CBS domain-containing protein
MMANVNPPPAPPHRPRVVRDLMTSDVVSISPDAQVSRAVELLADAHVSGLAVIDHHERLIGVVSTTDLLNAEAEAGDDAARNRLWSVATVRDIMTARALTVSPDLELREAALQMDYGDVHRLFVEADGRLIGVISRSDINRAFATGRLVG